MSRPITALSALLFLVTGCGDPPEGQVTIRLTRTLASDGALTSLSVPIADVSLQPERTERDAGGYIPLGQQAQAYPIVDASPFVAGYGTAPSGVYERIFVQVEGLMLEGTGADGETLDVENHVEPIAVTFEVEPGVHRVIDLELIILKNLNDGGPSYTLFCKDVSVVR